MQLPVGFQRGFGLVHSLPTLGPEPRLLGRKENYLFQIKCLVFVA